MELVAFLGKDTESWGQVNALVNKGEWDNVVLVKSKEADSFPKKEKCEIISVDTSRSLVDLREDLISKLKKQLDGEFEVALSIASGNGKEHMALISALLSIPVGIRLCAFTKTGVAFIN